MTGAEKCWEIRTMMKLRCSNLEEINIYSLEEVKGLCVFCKEGKDNMDHLVEECKIAKGCFIELGIMWRID